MALKPISVTDLFQSGRVNDTPIDLGKSFLRFAQVLTTDEYLFQFPQGQGAANTFGIVKGVFIDNSNNSYEMNVFVAGTGQTFPVPANATGWFPVDALEGSTITVISDGASADVVEFIFYNFAVVPFVYYKFGSSISAVSIPDGADVTQGAVADAAATPGGTGTVSAKLRLMTTQLLSLQNLLTTLADDTEYEACAAGVTTTLGGAGAIGDKLQVLWIIPGTTSPGPVDIKDGGGAAIRVFTGGASSVSNLVPFPIAVGIKSVNGAWQVINGANVTALAAGNFT